MYLSFMEFHAWVEGHDFEMTVMTVVGLKSPFFLYSNDFDFFNKEHLKLRAAGYIILFNI